MSDLLSFLLLTSSANVWKPLCLTVGTLARVGSPWSWVALYIGLLDHKYSITIARRLGYQLAIIWIGKSWFRDFCNNNKGWGVVNLFKVKTQRGQRDYTKVEGEEREFGWDLWKSSVSSSEWRHCDGKRLNRGVTRERLGKIIQRHRKLISRRN